MSPLPSSHVPQAACRVAIAAQYEYVSSALVCPGLGVLSACVRDSVVVVAVVAGGGDEQWWWWWLSGGGGAGGGGAGAAGNGAVVGSDGGSAV